MVRHRQARLIDAGFPAEEYRLVEPGYLIETPVDDRGLVDAAKHVDLVKQTLSSEIDWGLHKPNKHHLYWPAGNYKGSTNKPESTESTFRNLIIHQGIMPIQFHNWLHEISEPPEMPELDVMEYRVEAWSVAASLFDAVRSYKRKTRSLRQYFLRDSDNDMSGLSEVEREVLDDLYADFFNRYPDLHNRLTKVPEQFQLVDPEQPFDELLKDIGKIVGAKALYFTKTVALG